MKLPRRSLLAATLAMPLGAQAQSKDTAMLEDVARRAAIFLFPLYEMYRTRWQATVNEANPFRQKLNRFFHVPVLANHRSRMVTTPNDDTLYSTAWLDLSLEPLFLTVPPMGERYYSFAFMSLFTDNFAYVCRRLDGAVPKPRMIVGPSWTGDAPNDVVLVRAPTNSVWLLGRILVDAPDDLGTAHALQAKTLLETPDMRNERRILEIQELMRHRSVMPPEATADWSAPKPANPFDLFDVGMAALGESPLGAHSRTVLDQLAPLRLRPGHRFDARAFSDTERQAIDNGIAAALGAIRGSGGRGGETVEGWSYPDRSLGNYGDNDLFRAVVALGGLGALELAEATYLTCATDATGQPLDGTGRYVLRFEAGHLPPAKAFWSLAMYEVTPEGRAYFTDNPLGRYSIGDRTKRLKTNADGSLEIVLQHARPEPAQEANWLPAPAGPMRLVLRAYEPDETLLDGRFRLPAVKRIG